MLGAVLAPSSALAKADDALASADDAFGTAVGKETSGIYNDRDVRGFSPIDAGNVRIDGLYYDPVSSLSSRLRESTAIRVGFAAIGFPFGAPTGIADYRFRPFPEETGATVHLRWNSEGEAFLESDLRLPVMGDKIGITGGLSLGNNRKSTGYRSNGGAVTLRPLMRFGAVEFAPFATVGWTDRDWNEQLALVAGPWMPDHPRHDRFLGQAWTHGRKRTLHAGATLKASLADDVFLQAGLFRSAERKVHTFTEIFSIADAEGTSNHLVVANPNLVTRALSGEARVTWMLGARGRIVAGARFRDRFAQSGGADIRNLGRVRYGDLTPRARPELHYGPVTDGRVRQGHLMIGYLGDLDPVHLNIGIQRAFYGSSLRDGLTGARPRTREQSWLYNAVAAVDLGGSVTFYAGTQKGLEDSGAAPETAANRNQQLPATLATQYEGGLRWKLGEGALAISAFQITKPYFAYDRANTYARMGTTRLRGLEASLGLHPVTGMSLLAGAILMRPRVSGDGVDQGQVGSRPTGKPALRIRLDGSYRTSLWNGFEPTLALAYTGRRAAGVAPQPELGGRQLMAADLLTVDLGFRQPLAFGPARVTLRANLENAFDARGWKVIAANTVYPEERRRVSLALFADF